MMTSIDDSALCATCEHEKDFHALVRGETRCTFGAPGPDACPCLHFESSDMRYTHHIREDGSCVEHDTRC